MHFSRPATAVASAALLLALAAPAHAATTRFDDGSFEYQKAPANSFTDLGVGQSIGPWQVTSGTVDLIGAGFWQAAEGDQSVDLNGTGPGEVAQTFSTTPGTRYTVSYDLAGNSALAPAVKSGMALIDGQDFQDFTFDTTGKSPTAMGYVGRVFSFVAVNPSTTLAFASTNPGAAGPVLDNVQVTACPSCPSC
ncbi:choice-of-anchor C family protein [Kitasatospora viridis]|uniref:Choice-of-anchor C domain-containing protein n=1 Tax=Kitasatospora viridis TaxID=281105 RepID=A0A561UN43_9ACTN|nr:choice-of-anchor C family protein [Kitasatospora viridis]TWG00783.1 choice-of-anchor C domain-containing protein [Kitasatospora viridis]